jgi:hypothetical protein
MTLTTNPAPVTPAPAVLENGLRDIKPPVEIPSGWEWLWWTLLGAVALLAAFAFWRAWRRKQTVTPIVPPLPAHLRAKQQLQDALALIGQPKPFVTAVSDAARHYLEARFQFHAPERTTEEFLHELNRTELLTRDQKASLGDFLASCDLVKFARYEPGEPELRALHASAWRLVEETEPAPAAPATGPSPVADAQTQARNPKSGIRSSP